MWECNDLFNYLHVVAGENKDKIYTWEEPTRFVETIKHTLVKYPQLSRPVLTKMAYQETRAITTRLLSKQKYRITRPSLVTLMNVF